MLKKMMILGAVGMVLAVAACKAPERNPDDRFATVHVGG